jgi:SPP1 gp7 family putative phage head morphogenesis protein
LKPNEIVLAPIRETTEDYDKLEKKLKELFRKEIYYPLLKELGLNQVTLANAKEDPLQLALRLGRVTFSRGVFSGKFNAGISKRLKELGAKWDRKTETFRVYERDLPYEIRGAIQASEVRFKEKIAGIDEKLAKMLPEEIADKLKVEKVFDTSLWKVDREVKHSLESITVSAQLTPEQRAKIAREWQDNMKLWVQDFTKSEIVKLRKDVQKSTLAGNRYGSLLEKIQDSYDVSQNKAKFLARQETSLLMAKFKEVRYSDAGVKEYYWGCVAGSKKHPVRPWHKALEGKKFSWDNPPITTKPGESVRRNNPGQDYNCRCFAKPVVSFKVKT